MWEEWEHKNTTPIKAEKYKEKAFIDIYKVDDHYEMICSITDFIIFHTIFAKGTEVEALSKYEKVKKDLQHIIDSSSSEEETDDLCYEFIEKW